MKIEMRKKLELRKAWDEGSRLGWRFKTRERMMDSWKMSIEEILKNEADLEKRIREKMDEEEAYLSSFLQ